MKYFAIPFHDGETATMYFDANDLLEGHPDQSNITLAQLKDIYEKNQEVMSRELTYNQHVANIMNFCVYADGKECEAFTYCFTHLAIIDIEHVDMLHKVNEKCWESNGGDSALYAACEVFHTMCKGVATKVIELHNNCVIEEM